MCGILGLVVKGDASAAEVVWAEKQSQKQKHRGPDQRGSRQAGGIVVCHERLSIVDLQGGQQPLHHHFRGHNILSIVNGEIYNHLQIRDGLPPPVQEVLYTHSDSEAVAGLYMKHLDAQDTAWIQGLDGMFAFVLVDVTEEGSRVRIGRDPIGIKPLYVGYVCGGHRMNPCEGVCPAPAGDVGEIWFASEMKCLTQCCRVEECPPGHSASIHPSQSHPLQPLSYIPHYQPGWYTHPSTITISEEEQAVSLIREKLTQAVEKRMMADVDVGVFLSGGLDSSITAALCQQYIRHHGSQSQLHSFCVGLPDSPDILHAREMATHLGTEHHERLFTIEEGIEALEQVIYHLETYDVPLLCSAVPQFFISQLAAEYVKVVLTGEGADELFAGYVHFGDASHADELRQECKRLTRELGMLNLRRCDRMTMAFSLEARVPFLDVELIDAVFGMDPHLFTHAKDPLRPEKALLRRAFGSLLTEKVAQRTKLMFSEGVGDQWTQQLHAHCEAAIDEDDFLRAKAHYGEASAPTSRTELYVRRLYEKHFGASHAGVVCLWKPGQSYTTKESAKSPAIKI